MKNIINFAIVILILFAAGCGKKVSNQTSEVKNTAEKVESVEFNCPGMHCSGCEETIADEVKKIDGIKTVSADSKTKVVKVSYDAGKTSKENISKTINAAGYDTELSKTDTKHDCENDMKEEKKN
ncbi:MAG: heavy-metal-associated domain-containing protein [Ignavibacteria bacterium]|nr:heavy-metal-associated domain-containing protein [Ignavibacteria bacterium]